MSEQRHNPRECWCGINHAADERSEQERLGAELLSLRRRSPKAPLSKLHDKLMERAR